MRQYELNDCPLTAQKGDKVEIASACISIDCSGEVDWVVIFGDPNTKKIAFVPFNSKIKIENNEYKLIKGEKYAGKRYAPTKGQGLFSRITGRIYNHSSECIIDKEGKLHNLEYFIGKEAIVL